MSSHTRIKFEHDKNSTTRPKLSEQYVSPLILRNMYQLWKPRVHMVWSPTSDVKVPFQSASHVLLYYLPHILEPFIINGHSRLLKVLRSHQETSSVDYRQQTFLLVTSRRVFDGYGTLHMFTAYVNFRVFYQLSCLTGTPVFCSCNIFRAAENSNRTFPSYATST